MAMGLRSNLNNCASGNFYEDPIGPTGSNYVYWNERVLIEEVLLSAGELVCNFVAARNVSLTENPAREIVCCYEFSTIKPIDQHVGKLNVLIRD